jgi:hypothetical protein
MKTFLKVIKHQTFRRRRKYQITAHEQNNGIQRIAKNARPMMPGVGSKENDAN